MERGILVKNIRTGMIPVLMCLCLISLDSAMAATQRSLVVVCSVESPLTSISNTEVRKLFLGVPVIKGNTRLNPLRNVSDKDIEEVFLQKVIFMSKRDYERRLLSTVFRRGGERPVTYSDTGELIGQLKSSPDSLSYMWSDQIEQLEELRSIGVLWTDQTD